MSFQLMQSNNDQKRRLTDLELEDLDHSFMEAEAVKLDQDIIQQTLSLRLFEKFSKKKMVKDLPKLYTDFKNGHIYFETFHMLFQYETFCQLRNFRSNMDYSNKISVEKFNKKERACFEANLQPIKQKKKKYGNGSKAQYEKINLLEFKLYQLGANDTKLKALKGYNLILITTNKLTEEEFG